MNQNVRYGPVPDVRDGLTFKERAVLTCLRELQNERQGRNVSTSIPTPMLYGRVVEVVDISVEEMQEILQRFVGIEGGC